MLKDPQYCQFIASREYSSKKITIIYSKTLTHAMFVDSNRNLQAIRKIRVTNVYHEQMH